MQDFHKLNHERYERMLAIYNALEKGYKIVAVAKLRMDTRHLGEPRILEAEEYGEICVGPYTKSPFFISYVTAACCRVDKRNVRCFSIKILQTPYPPSKSR